MKLELLGGVMDGTGTVTTRGAGVTATVGVVQATLVEVVVQLVLWVLKLSKLLFTQPPSESVATAKTNPLTRRIVNPQTSQTLQNAGILLILR